MNTYLPQISSCLEALAHAHKMFTFSEAQETIRQGNKVLRSYVERCKIIFFQTLQVSFLNEHFDVVAQAFGKKAIPRKYKAALLLLPTILEVGQSVMPFAAKKIVSILDRWGPACQTASLVASVVLLVARPLNGAAYAITSISILAFNLLGRQILPADFYLSIRRGYNQIVPFSANIAGILSKGYLDKCIAAVSIAGDLDKYINASPLKAYASISHPHLLTYTQLQSLMQLQTVSVNREHVFIEPFPTVQDPLLKISRIAECWDSFKWEEEPIFTELWNKVQKDPRWKESPERAASSRLKKFPVSYAKRMLLEQLVDRIKNKNIEAGSPPNYAYLQNQLAFIGEQLSSATPLHQRQILLDLALEGGGMCGRGVYEQVGKAASSLLYTSQCESKNLPLKQRLLILFQALRVQLFDGFYEYYQEIRTLMKDKNNVHDMSFVQQVFGEKFGLPDAGVSSDPAQKIENFEKKWYAWLGGSKGPKETRVSAEQLWQDVKRWDGKQKKLYRGYTVEHMLEALRDGIRDDIISKTDIYEWAQGWIESDVAQANESQKEAFLQDLEDTTKFEEGIGDQHDTAFKDAFLKAMLVDMGILSLGPVD